VHAPAFEAASTCENGGSATPAHSLAWPLACSYALSLDTPVLPAFIRIPLEVKISELIIFWLTLALEHGGALNSTANFIVLSRRPCASIELAF
jgi:hypothetical protein